MHRIASIFAFLVISFSQSTQAAPITETVLVGDREWAQVDLFRGINWVDTNALCPKGVCGYGTIRGHDMYGWKWASVNDVNALFNHYIGAPLLGPGPDFYEDGNEPTFGFDFFADGWHNTRLVGIPDSLVGYTYGVTSTNSCIGGPCGALLIAYQGGSHLAVTDRGLNYGYNPSSVGGWFYRDVTAVSVPSSLLLGIVGLLVLAGQSPAQIRAEDSL